LAINKKAKILATELPNFTTSRFDYFSQETNHGDVIIFFRWSIQVMLGCVFEFARRRHLRSFTKKLYESLHKQGIRAFMDGKGFGAHAHAT